VDTLLQAPYLPQFAYNNTYGLSLISESGYNQVLNDIVGHNGCQDLIRQCRAIAAEKDPDFTSNNEEVNAICASQGILACAMELLGAGVFNSTVGLARMATITARH
jgi:hypothetical protein